MKRFEVIECLQPGFGEENWKVILETNSLPEAIAIQKEFTHGYSRDIYDRQDSKTVIFGWRIGE